MNVPIATYRLQLNRTFGFKDIHAIVSYLCELGISTIYASPIFQSCPKSMHGYDTVNPCRIDAEIGTLAEFKELHHALKEAHMSWLQDFVPNHMAYDSKNTWLMDIFERGKESVYYDFFDIDWSDGKVLAPFLGGSIEDVLGKKELCLVSRDDKFLVKYYDLEFPLSYDSYSLVKEILSQGASRDPVVREFFLEPVAMRRILERQYFQLANWKESEQQINYRRFFTVNGLICLRMEQEDVFQKYHAFFQELTRDDLFQGIRVDHIDGLYDPEKYLERLRESLGRDCYILIEKILEGDEALPSQWPIQGTTGYDFLGLVNQLYVDAANQDLFDQLYKAIFSRGNGDKDYETLVYEKKRMFFLHRMGGELKNLVGLLKRLTQALGQPLLPGGDDTLWDTLLTWLCCFPVYRTYLTDTSYSDQDRHVYERAMQKAQRYAPHLKESLQWMRHILWDNIDADQKRSFLMRLQQFTGPLMAKGVEDTSFYIYNRLLSRNEVGDTPQSFGIGIAAFHQRIRKRHKEWPWSMNASATHDTKRGEDMRMRLNALSEIPDEWGHFFSISQKRNKTYKKMISHGFAPDTNDEYFVYQTMLGAFPMDGQTSDEFFLRIEEYCIKAIREAKIHTNWSSPNSGYEEGVIGFIHALLKSGYVLDDEFSQLHQKLSFFGMFYSLGQLVLKLTLPGVPDIYQGCELWDFSLVDPDNRRPVDFAQRIGYLQEITRQEQNILEDLRTGWKDGRIKMFTLHKGLQFRNHRKDVFAYGDYIPLTASGSCDQNVVAFLRRYKKDLILVVVPRCLAQRISYPAWPLGKSAWQNETIAISVKNKGRWTNIFTDQTWDASDEIPLADIFHDWPVAVLYAAT